MAFLESTRESTTSLSGFIAFKGAKATSTMIKARFNTWLIVSPLLLATSYPVLAGGVAPQVCADGTPGWVTLGIQVSAVLSAMLSLATILLIVLLSTYLDMVSSEADSAKPWQTPGQTLWSEVDATQLSELMSKDSTPEVTRAAVKAMLEKKARFDKAIQAQIDDFVSEKQLLTEYGDAFGLVTHIFCLSILAFACMVPFTLACVFSKIAGVVLGSLTALLAVYVLVVFIAFLGFVQSQIVGQHLTAKRLIDAQQTEMMRDRRELGSVLMPA